MGTLDAPLTRRFITDAVYRGRSDESLTAVANESAWYDSSQSNGTDTYLQTRKRHLVIADCKRIRVVYANTYNRDSTPTNAITVRAGLEIGSDKSATSTVIVPLTFSGARDVVIAAGGYAISDPLHITLPAATAIWSRTLVTVASAGMKWPLQGGGSASSNQANTTNLWGEGVETGTGTPTDKTTSGTITATSGSTTYCPVVIAGEYTSPQPYVCCEGDSIMSGLGDTGAAGVIPDSGRGFVRRALNNTIPHVSVAASGQNLSESVFMREFLMAPATDVICNTGINDLRIGGTLASTQAAWIYRWRRWGCRPCKVWACTLTPITTSTDNWATTGNQSKYLSVTAEGYRTGLNDWLRDGAPLNGTTWSAAAVGATGVLRAGQTGHPLAGVFDVADQVETARNSGIWKVGTVYQGDNLGLHPNGGGYTVMATAIDTTLFARRT